MVIRRSRFFVKFILAVVIRSFIAIPFVIFSGNLLAEDLKQEFHKAENFALLDNRGKFQELYYYSDMKAIVIISQGNGCPILRKSVPYLNLLQEEFSSQGVVFLMINANPQDDRTAINQEASDFNIQIPILEDTAQVVTEGLNIKRIAEAIVIDPKRWSVMYHGPINDQLGYETQKARPDKEYLKEAINAVLHGKEVQQVEHMVKGCLINLNTQKEKEELTYARDVAPILINKCMQCHAPGQIAPWSMNNYEKIKGWGPMIREVIRTKRMPPWVMDPHYDKFRDDVSLTPKEVQTIVHWQEQGMARGEGDDPLIKASAIQPLDWPLGPPDMIVTFDQQQEIPPTGIIDYRYIHGNKIMKQDQWLKAIAWKIDNKKVVHHATLYFMADQLKFDAAKKIDNGRVLDATSPARPPLVFPKDTGILLTKGTQFFFELHYTTSGKQEKDLTEAGLYFYKTPPPKVFLLRFIKDRDFVIPPRVKEWKIQGSSFTKHDVAFYGFRPHAHWRGKRINLRIRYLDETVEEVLNVPYYKFLWQTRYLLKEPMHLPAGTRMEVEAVYDNSFQNLDNPNPDRTLRFGEQSQDEMFEEEFYFVEE